MSMGKQEPRAALLARMDERLRHMDERQEELISDVRELRTNVSDLSTWRAGLRGTWRTVLLVSGMLAFVISLAVTLFATL